MSEGCYRLLTWFRQVPKAHSMNQCTKRNGQTRTLFSCAENGNTDGENDRKQCAGFDHCFVIHLANKRSVNKLYPPNYRPFKNQSHSSEKQNYLPSLPLDTRPRPPLRPPLPPPCSAFNSI